VERVLSDNGACFKRRWTEACAAHGIVVKKTGDYCLQTDGKAERFIRTLLERWACAYPLRDIQLRACRRARLPCALGSLLLKPPPQACAPLTSIADGE